MAEEPRTEAQMRKSAELVVDVCFAVKEGDNACDCKIRSERDGHIAPAPGDHDEEYTYHCAYE